jgi:hypothetical protein
VYTQTRNLFHRHKKSLPYLKRTVREECSPKLSEYGCLRSYYTHSRHFNGIFNVGCPWRWSDGVKAAIYVVIELQCDMFRLNYKRSSGEIRVPKKRCHVKYIEPLLLSVYVVEISTVHFSLEKLGLIHLNS